MIPVRLALRNFMCYRDNTEVLDLTGIHMACLSGENGAGKSALLEAITWSLWGVARGHQMSDELISKGATEMEVDYHFILGDQHYRVVRKRALKGKSGTTILDIQMASDPEGDTWRSLSGATIMETQSHINNLLKLKYDTFINSAFILQGRADEFTTKNPADRKQILADILGLQEYDRLEDRAKEEVRIRRSRIQELDAIIAQINRELSRRPEYARDLEEVTTELTSAQERLAAMRTELGELQTRKQALEHSRARLLELDTRLKRRDVDIISAQARITRDHTRKDEYESLITRRSEIETGFRDLESAEREAHAYNETVQLLRRLEGDRSAWSQQISTEGAYLQAERRAMESKIAGLERNLAGRGTANQQLSTTLAELQKLEGLQQQHEDTKCKRDALDVKMRVISKEKETCEEEGKTLREKLKLINSAHAEGKGHVDCPLCGTDLTQEALQRVRRTFDEDIAAKRREFDSKRKEQEAINAEILAAARDFEEESRRLKPLNEYRRRAADDQQRLEALDRDEATLTTARAELQAVTQKLDMEAYAPEARRELSQVTAQIAALNYDEDAYIAVRGRVSNLKSRGYSDLYHKLSAADRELPAIIASLDAEDRNLALLNEEQERERLERATLQPQVQQLDEVAASLANMQRVERDLASQVSELGERRGGLRNKLLHCDSLQEQKSDHMTEYTTATDEKAIYEELTNAFGKKGIQAMIIENIVPEIEDETNKILERMTDGRMSVHLVTQKDAKTVKSVIETLDINIADEMGTRAYEMYSGGEAFRVNFAIRIALSKLLARRAGTQLQTLVIDEGFGSQDGQGREKLIGAIRSIQDDFEKILVITHIEELKDEFPVRIDIVKTNSGSKIVMSALA